MCPPQLGINIYLEKAEKQGMDEIDKILIYNLTLGSFIEQFLLCPAPPPPSHVQALYPLGSCCSIN